MSLTLLGCWAVQAGDDRLALKLMDEGCAEFVAVFFRRNPTYRPGRPPCGLAPGPSSPGWAASSMSLMLGLPALGREMPEINGGMCGGRGGSCCQKAQKAHPNEITLSVVRGRAMRLDPQAANGATLSRSGIRCRRRRGKAETRPDAVPRRGGMESSARPSPCRGWEGPLRMMIKSERWRAWSRWQMIPTPVAIAVPSAKTGWSHSGCLPCQGFRRRAVHP